MKKRLHNSPIWWKSVTRLFSIILVLFTINSNGQGWTFTFQLAESGPCGGGPFPVLPTFPNFGLPTQSYCESMRQLILNISASTPIYDNQGHFIGNCKVYYKCSECTGSDIVSPSAANPGDVDFNNQTDGKPLFTPHSSEAFEDWARDYKALLESYGITSILGDVLSPHPFPLTDDKKFNQRYAKDCDDFNPKVDSTDTGGVYIGGSWVANSMDDLLKKKVEIPGDSYNNDVETSYNIKLKEVPPLPDGEKQIEKNETDEQINSVREEAVELAGMLPPGTNYAAIAVVDAVAADVTVIHDCFYTSNCPSSGEVATNITVNLLTDLGSAYVGEKVKDIGLTAIKDVGMSNVINSGQTGIAPLQEILHKVNMGEKIITVAEFLGNRVISDEQKAW
jgi:hypothetical protein